MVSEATRAARPRSAPRCGTRMKVQLLSPCPNDSPSARSIGSLPRTPSSAASARGSWRREPPPTDARRAPQAAGLSRSDVCKLLNSLGEMQWERLQGTDASSFVESDDRATCSQLFPVQDRSLDTIDRSTDSDDGIRGSTFPRSGSVPVLPPLRTDAEADRSFVSPRSRSGKSSRQNSFLPPEEADRSFISPRTRSGKSSRQSSYLPPRVPQTGASSRQTSASRRPLARSGASSRQPSSTRSASLSGRSARSGGASSSASTAASSRCSSAERTQRRRGKDKEKVVDKEELAKQLLADQTEALAVVVEQVGSFRQLGDLAALLLRHVLKHDGTVVFSPNLIENKAAEFCRRQAKPPPMDAAVDHQTPVQRATTNLVKLLRSLEEYIGKSMSLSDIIGQILWRHRRSLRHSTFRHVAESDAWLLNGDVPEDVLDMVDAVFSALTAGEGGRMKVRQWNRAVNLILRNPVLSTRVSHSDVDRLFYCETHRASSTTSSPVLGRSEFRRLLMQLAEASGVHPVTVFVACGCHAETLQAEAEAAPAPARASAKRRP